jgi:sugar-phosphatase
MLPCRAALFDLDGLLLDSEPLWRKAQLTIMQSHNIPITREECEQSAGLRLDHVLRLWQHKYNWDTIALPLPALEVEIKNAVINLIQKEGQLMPGANECVELALKHGLRLALVSSSSRAHIAEGLRFFASGTFVKILSGQDVERAKPHPEMFLQAAAALKCAPESCIVFEDSLPGVIAAKAASMRCIAVPASEHLENPRFSLADIKLRSLAEFRLNMLI